MERPGKAVPRRAEIQRPLNGRATASAPQNARAAASNRLSHRITRRRPTADSKRTLGMRRATASAPQNVRQCQGLHKCARQKARLTLAGAKKSFQARRTPAFYEPKRLWIICVPRYMRCRERCESGSPHCRRTAFSDISLSFMGALRAARPDEIGGGSCRFRCAWPLRTARRNSLGFP